MNMTVPVSRPQKQSLQVEVQPLVFWGLQGPGAGPVQCGVGSVVGRGGQHPPYGGVLHCAPTQSWKDKTEADLWRNSWLVNVAALNENWNDWTTETDIMIQQKTNQPKIQKYICTNKTLMKNLMVLVFLDVYIYTSISIFFISLTILTLNFVRFCSIVALMVCLMRFKLIL